MILSWLVAMAGVLTAWFVYGLKHKINPALLKLIPGGPQALEKKYYVDELYEASVVKGVKALANWVSDRLIEQIMVNGLVHLVTETATGLSRWAQKSQTGLVRVYLAYVAVGAALLIYWMIH
jgi:NADH-quinone oxidoreductase subunit L